MTETDGAFCGVDYSIEVPSAERLKAGELRSFEVIVVIRFHWVSRFRL